MKKLIALILIFSFCMILFAEEKAILKAEWHNANGQSVCKEKIDNKITLYVECENIKDRKTVTYKIFYPTQDFKRDKPLKTLTAKIKTGKAEVSFDFNEIMPQVSIDEALYRYYKNQGKNIPRKEFERHIRDYDDDILNPPYKEKPKFVFVASVKNCPPISSAELELSKDITITVLDRRGEREKDAKVYLKEPDGQEHIIVTGEDGLAIFEDLIPGSYHFKIARKRNSLNLIEKAKTAIQSVALLFTVFAAEVPDVTLQIDELTVPSYKDIRCKPYILSLEPWKDGKLATLDGWGRFSTFEITEKDKVKVTPLVKFPRKQIDGLFVTYPEIDVMWSSSFFAVQFFSDIKNNKNVETVPIYTNRYQSKTPYLLDSRKKIFLIPYGSMSTVENYDYLIYDFENDKVIYNPVEKEEDFKKNYIVFNFGNGLFLCQERDINDRSRLSKNYCLFNYYKNKCIRNKLTDVLALEEFPYIIKMNGENRLIITSYGNKIYVTYNDDFSEIKTEYIVSPFFQKMKEKGLDTTFTKIDQNNEWGVGKIYGYKGLFGESLYKYFFVNLKKGSPYYLIPVITEEYYEWDPDGYFIEHPVYGTCYIEKVKKDDKDYIRLYRMSDVQAKIEEYLLEKAKHERENAIENN